MLFQVEMSNKTTVPSMTLEPTSDPDLFRLCDRKGDWTHYFHQPTKRYLPAVNHILHTAYNKGERFMQYLLSVSKDEAKDKLERAGNRGTRVHQAINEMILGKEIRLDTTFLNELTGRHESLTDDEWKMLRSFTRWVEDFKPETVIFDTAVCSLKSGFAGTLDWYGTVSISVKTAPQKVEQVRVYCLIDWKSSSAVWDEYAYQLGGYDTALIEKGVIGSDTCCTAILRLGTKHKSGYEFKLYSPEESAMNRIGWMQVRSMFVLMTGGEEFNPVIEEIPTTLQVKIPQVVVKPKKRKYTKHVK